MYFVNLLNKLRVGRPLTLEEEDNLLSHPLSFDAKTALRIYPFRAKVDAFNESKLQTLTSAQRVYGCMDSYVWFEDKHPDLEDHFRRLIEGDTNSPFSFFSRDRHRYAEEVAIKEGMPVVLLRNLDFSAGLVNGSRGHVVGLESVKLADFSGQKFNKLDYILAVGGAKRSMRKKRLSNCTTQSTRKTKSVVSHDQYLKRMRDGRSCGLRTARSALFSLIVPSPSLAQQSRTA